MLAFLGFVLEGQFLLLWWDPLYQVSARSLQRRALSWRHLAGGISVTLWAWLLEMIHSSQQVIHSRNRMAKAEPSRTALCLALEKRRDFPVTFNGNAGAELLINGNIQNWETFLDVSPLIKTAALALPTVFNTTGNLIYRGNPWKAILQCSFSGQTQWYIN